MKKIANVAFVLFLIVSAFWLLRAYQPVWRINALTANMIGPGMTMEEVDAILGSAPGDYRLNGNNSFTTMGNRWQTWETDTVHIVVDFDPPTRRSVSIRVKHTWFGLFDQ